MNENKLREYLILMFSRSVDESVVSWSRAETEETFRRLKLSLLDPGVQKLLHHLQAEGRVRSEGQADRYLAILQDAWGNIPGGQSKVL